MQKIRGWDWSDLIRAVGSPKLTLRRGDKRQKHFKRAVEGLQNPVLKNKGSVLMIRHTKNPLFTLKDSHFKVLLKRLQLKAHH